MPLLYDPSITAPQEAGQQKGDVLQLLDGDGPGWVPPGTQDEDSGFNFADDPLFIESDTPYDCPAPYPLWWLAVAAAAGYFIRGGR
jgi:hypothetical protein